MTDDPPNGARLIRWGSSYAVASDEAAKRLAAFQVQFRVPGAMNALRTHLGLDEGQFAEALEVSAAYIEQIDRCQFRLSVALADRLALLIQRHEREETT